MMFAMIKDRPQMETAERKEVLFTQLEILEPNLPLLSEENTRCRPLDID